MQSMPAPFAEMQIWHWVILVVNLVAFWRILPRTGLSRWFTLLAAFPIGVYILVAVIAFKKWPGEAK